MLNLESFSRVYESSIIVSYNNKESHKLSLDQIENNNIKIITSSNEYELNEFKKDCIEKNVIIYSIISKKYICYQKKVTYSKEQFTYILKKSYNNDYNLYFQSIIILLVFFIISIFFTAILLKNNKLLNGIDKDAKLFEKCLNLIQKKEYNKCQEIAKKINITELYEAVHKIIIYNKKIKISSKESNKKSIIIHDLSKIIECIPNDLDKGNINFENLKKIIVNIKNLLNPNYIKKGEYDIKNCIFTASEILTYNKIDYDMSRVRSHVLFGNEKSMIQVFINLFSNIVEHSIESSGIKVFVNTYLEKINDNINYICVIKNTGSFVEFEKLNTIMSKTFTTNSDKIKSYGTGLYYCKKVIEGYHGSITCDSQNLKEDNNSYFQVRIQIPTIYLEKIKKSDNLSKVDSNDVVKNIPEDFVISIVDDDKNIIDKWKNTLGIDGVNYFNDPDEFILEFKDNPEVSRTKLIIFDYYFNSMPVDKLLDFRFLRNVLLYKGKIFLHTSLRCYKNDNKIFDFIFENKNEFLDRKNLFIIFDNLDKFN